MTMSLRVRLILIILFPLLFIALVIGIFAFDDAQNRASDRFDRSLLSAVLAVSRDVAVSGGDALSPETNALLRDTSGGRVFYHVYAPDGVFVTGYASPPVPVTDLGAQDNGQQFFDGTYLGESVRVLRFVDAMQIDGLSGQFTFTVWQNTALRAEIVRDLSWRTFRIMASLVLAVALVVWFGVRIGLRPLLDLEAAIAQRNSDELTPIRRKVPSEATGIVSTLNGLLGQVASSMQAKDDFISNAAHQLRNPIAGVVAMSEATQSAKTLKDMKHRSAELVIAAHHASDLANKLLALERAKAKGPELETFRLADLVEDVFHQYQPKCADQKVELHLNVAEADVSASGDLTMLREALSNLIDNALKHGGPTLGRISLSGRVRHGEIYLSVLDDGQGIAPQNVKTAKERFGQVQPSSGSGLGLAIAEVTAQQHGGKLEILTTPDGFCVTIRFPRESAINHKTI